MRAFTSRHGSQRQGHQAPCRPGWPPTHLVAAVVLGFVGCFVGCGSDPTEGLSSATMTITGVETTVETTLVDAGSTAADTTETSHRSITGVFAKLAAQVAPMPVYGLAELAAGVVLAEQWLPVVYPEPLSEYEGLAEANPRVFSGNGGGPEIHVVLQRGEGWLVIVENCRGDLGEAAGTEVGSVEGRPAYLYEGVNGGTLVQWSDGGRWYGVFGRNVPTDCIVEMALEMHLVAVRASD